MALTEGLKTANFTTPTTTCWTTRAHLLLECRLHGLSQFGHVLGVLHLQMAVLLHVTHHVLRVLGPQFGPVQRHLHALFQLEKNRVHVLARQLFGRDGRRGTVRSGAGRRSRFLGAGRRPDILGALDVRREVLAGLHNQNFNLIWFNLNKILEN